MKKQWILILSLFFSSACNRSGTVRSDKPERKPDRTFDRGSCESKQISYEDSDCFYLLPKVSDGETFAAKYEDTSEPDTEGITLGMGLWLCQKGVWRQVQSPLCVTCPPGHSYEHCETIWNSLARNPETNSDSIPHVQTKPKKEPAPANPHPWEQEPPHNR